MDRNRKVFIGKQKQITLSGLYRVEPDMVGFPSHYRVERITNSTEFVPKELLTKAMVNDLCSAKDWTVMIVPAIH